MNQNGIPNHLRGVYKQIQPLVQQDITDFVAADKKDGLVAVDSQYHTHNGIDSPLLDYSAFLQGAAIAAGSDTQVQFNNMGSLGASSVFTFDGTSTFLSDSDGGYMAGDNSSYTRYAQTQMVNYSPGGNSFAISSTGGSSADIYFFTTSNNYKFYNAAANKQITLTTTNITADRTATFQNASGTLAYLSDITGGSPGGLTTQVQYNNAGAFAGDADFTFDSGTNKLSVPKIATDNIFSDSFSIYDSTGSEAGLIVNSAAATPFVTIGKDVDAILQGGIAFGAPRQLTIRTQNATGGNDANAILFLAGNTGNSDHAGGSIYLRAGDACGAATSGLVSLNGGNARGPILSIVFDSTGSGYVVSDVLTIDDSTSVASGATITVNSVDGGGAILTWTITTPGDGYCPSSLSDYSLNGGTGADADLDGFFISSNTSGGDIQINGGQSSEGGTAGNISIVGGQNSASATFGTGGTVSIYGGSTPTGGTPGNIYLKPGNSVSTQGLMQLADGLTGNSAILDLSILSTNRTFTFPNATGTIALTSDIVPAGVNQQLQYNNSGVFGALNIKATTNSSTFQTLLANGTLTLQSNSTMNFTAGQSTTAGNVIFSTNYTAGNVNFAAGTASGVIDFTPGSTGVTRIIDGSSAIKAIFDTTVLASSDKTFTFPNITGTFVVENATANLTAQTAAVGATTLFTPPITGFYRISIYLQVTTAASVSSILGGATGVVLTYKDGDGNVAQTDTAGLMSPAGAIVTTLNTNTTATNLNGTTVIYANSSTAVQFAIGYTSVGGTAMQYAAHIRAEAL